MLPRMAHPSLSASEAEPFETLIIDGDPGGLPMRLHTLIDPDRPLDRPERFFAFDVAMPVLGYIVMAVCGACCAGFIASAVKAAVDWQAGERLGPPYFFIALGLLAFFAWPTRWGWKQIGTYREQKRLIDAGRYRVGLYVEEDGLLVRETSGRITWLPRHAILGTGVGRPPGSEGGGGPKAGWINYRAPTEPFAILHLANHDVPSATLALALDRWIAGEPFERPRGL